MLTTALAVLFILTTQAVFTFAFNSLQLNFTEVQQCRPFALTFTGENGQGPTLATTLTIVPFNSSPVVVQLPNPQALRGGVFSTSLPYPAGTRFIASLENGNGEPVVNLSGTMTVIPTQPESDDSCLVQPTGAGRVFSVPVEQTISQCGNFTVLYNATAVRQAPRVRVYNPRGFSYALNRTSNDPDVGVATFSMDVERGKEVVLLIDGGSGIRETSQLLTVTGDSTSPQSCLSRQREVEVAMEAASKTSQAIASKAVIIGSAVGGGSIVLIAVVMCIFMVRERKRRQRAELRRRSSFDGTRMSRDADVEKQIQEKPKMPPPTFVLSSAPKNPPPTYRSNQDAKLLNSPPSINRPDSGTSWVQITPPDQRPRNPRYQSMAPSLALSESRNVMPQSVDERDRLSINSLDIEGMLNMATLQTESARKSSTNTLFGPDLTSASPPKPRIITDGIMARRELKVNSDIPDDLQSAYSRDSVNPFSTPVNDPDSPHRRRLPLARPPPTASPFARPSPGGLPVSPRGRQGVSRVSSAASADWYEVGIAK